MTQAGTKSMFPWDFGRRRAFRRSYEDYRRGKPPTYGTHRGDEIVYECARMTAAHIDGRGDQPREIPINRALSEDDLSYLMAANSRANRKGR